MIKYAKIINDNGQCEVGIGTNAEYYISVGMTQFDVEQSEVDNQWYLTEKCPHKSEEEKEREERERKDAMILTPADVWRALYKAKFLTQNGLLTLIEEQTLGIDIEAIKIEFGANLFYRGAKLGNNKMFDVIGNLLGYTSDDMDYLFEHKELPEKENAND